MTTNWKLIVSELEVPEPGKQWKLAVEVLQKLHFMKVEVIVNPNSNPPELGRWRPLGFAHECSADGDYMGTLRGATGPIGTPLLSGVPIGALIGKIGGSTADQTLDNAEKPSHIIFSIGRICVFAVPENPAGALFLGINDDPLRMPQVAGRLRVNIYESV